MFRKFELFEPFFFWGGGGEVILDVGNFMIKRKDM